ncbi:MAG: hypothetical protein LBC61_07520 [Candidatus Peribacteria bacterium]|nr:hypothetical protein [Candidatus Peribacteria bacterium]
MIVFSNSFFCWSDIFIPVGDTFVFLLTTSLYLLKVHSFISQSQALGLLSSFISTSLTCIFQKNGFRKFNFTQFT